MSSRALKRLQEQKELEEAAKLAKENENEDDQTNIPNRKTKKKKKGNMFDLLQLEEQTEETNEPSAEEENQETTELAQPVKKSTKKKKKKRKSNKCHEDYAEDELDGLDEIDRATKLLGIITTNQQAESSQDGETGLRNKSLLAVDTRHLNSENEMRRKFGSSIINQERRRNPHGKRFKKPTKLVTPKDNWPSFTKVGITMEAESSNDSFTFIHQPAYQKVQFLFYDAVDSMDHNRIMQLLHMHPYHIDSLLQLSEVCRMNEDNQMAADLIERALFIFENNFHTCFNISLGTCRLNYLRSENRPFFLALFRHIKFIGEKACYRTALEFCKLLLSLDPRNDPLCIILMIDYYAMKSEQYDYFIQLYLEYDFTKNVSMLPNFSYTNALALFYLNKREQANRAIKEALIKFPSLLVALMDMCGISLDDAIKKHPYFDPVSYIHQSPALNQLVALYVGRSHSLWKAPEVIDWLAEACKDIVDHFDLWKKKIEEAKLMRDSKFKSTPKNILRHIFISDIKEALHELSAQNRAHTILTYDPLPPEDSHTGYDRPANHQRGQQQSGNLLSLFFQSLMPSYDPTNEGHQGNQGQQARELQDQARAIDDGANGLGRETVRQGAEGLMNAMRQLLDTMTYRNDLENNENDEENNDWE